MRIDVHAHYFPQSFLDLLRKHGRADIANVAGAQSPDFTKRIEAIDATCTSVQILSASALDTTIDNEDGAVELCRHINDVYHAVTQQHDGRFGAFGLVPLPHIDAAIAEARRCLDELGFQGLTSTCIVNGKVLDDKEYEPFWAFLNERSAVMYLHPTGSQSACHPGMHNMNMHLAWGSPVQLPLTAARLVYSGLTKRYPKIQFIFAVCGGFLPYWWTRIETNLKRAVSGSANAAVGDKMFAWVREAGIQPQDTMAAFRKFWYDSSVQDVPAAMYCIKRAYGVDRVLLGSDEVFASLVEAVRYIETNDELSADEKAAILDRNAQSIFNFPASRNRWSAYRD